MAIVIVSALYDLASTEGSERRRVEEYLRLGQLLLESRHPLVVFAEPRLVSELAYRRRGFPTRIVPLPFEELPHADRVSEIEACFAAGRRGRASTNPTKDTSRYLALMWSKVALVARAGESFFAEADMLWWADFGIAHAASAHPELTFDELLESVQAPIHLTVRWQPSRREIVDRAAYFRETRGAKVGGSLFGADHERARWLADRVASEVDRCLGEGWPTTEEVLLGAVLAEHPDMCDVHFASPRTTLVNMLGTRSDPFVVLDAMRTLAGGDGEAERALEIALELEAAHHARRLHLGEVAEVELYDGLLVAAWQAGEHGAALRAARALEDLAARHPPDSPAGEALRTPRLRANVGLVQDLDGHLEKPGFAASLLGAR
ncbi:MAG: hypothetical protein ACYCST_12570 [Acidimicrobiales bacterium]